MTEDVDVLSYGAGMRASIIQIHQFQRKIKVLILPRAHF